MATTAPSSAPTPFGLSPIVLPSFSHFFPFLPEPVRAFTWLSLTFPLYLSSPPPPPPRRLSVIGRSVSPSATLGQSLPHSLTSTDSLGQSHQTFSLSHLEAASFVSPPVQRRSLSPADAAPPLAALFDYCALCIAAGPFFPVADPN